MGKEATLVRSFVLSLVIEASDTLLNFERPSFFLRQSVNFVMKLKAYHSFFFFADFRLRIVDFFSCLGSGLSSFFTPSTIS